MGRSRRSVVAPPPTSGAGHEVRRGRVGFWLTRTTVRCLECTAVQTTGGDGAAVQAFFAQHSHEPARTQPGPMRDRLMAAVDQLGADELEVLCEVAAGLVAGRAVYGELRLSTDRRDFDRETLDEMRDGLGYAAMAAIRRRRGAGGAA